MLIWFMNKIYLSFILVCCVQSYLLSLPLIKITARIDTRKCKEADKWRGSKYTNHHTYTDLSLTILFSGRSGLLY